MVAPDSSENQIPPASPYMVSAEFTLESVTRRYLLIYGTTDVWDTHDQVRIKKQAFFTVVGKKIGTEWLESGNKRLVRLEDVQAAIAQKQKNIVDPAGGVGVEAALKRYTYLYPSRTVWDHELREIVNFDDLKCALPNVSQIWLGHPDRKSIEKKNLVFDPTQSVDPATHINMFRGLPLTPVNDPDKCHAIRTMFFDLCNGDPDIWAWLAKWLAYPLQHVGAKMATAVLMHSEVHGSGKSLLFDRVMRPMYGDYSSTLGQHQMDTQYTDWRSNLLYGVFEELFSREGKYQNMGNVKQMITGDRFRVEKKFVSSWEESNHMNCVFLSNEIQPFPVEESDRRFLVIWPDFKMPTDLQKRVTEEIENGGVEAFYGWLLSYPLGDFGPHTKPPMTDAKERLIEFGRPGWETFFYEWQNGYLDVPFITCAVTQIYDVYKQWCGKNKENILGRNKFSNLMSRRVRLRKNLRYDIAMGRRQHAFFIVQEMPEGKIQAHWLGECYEKFQEYMGNQQREVE
ncbi:MAG: hypothetical protein CSB48_02855 [Proteobacteria bacterium]|nr:MAG: hypothetical protein CSB48_02855 [Pseudomonadota bacterium]